MRAKLAIALCLTLVACGGSGSAPTPGPAGPWPDALTVEHPVHLPATLPALKVPLGTGELKPNVILLPNGEVLLVDYSGENDPQGYTEHLNFYRSDDNGRTWGSRVTGPLGREGYFSLTRDGTLFVTVQVLSADYRNTYGCPTFVVYRSTDNGETWAATPVECKDVGEIPTFATEASRTITQLEDGSLLWITGADYTGVTHIWRSYDDGLTWDKTAAIAGDPTGFDTWDSYGEWAGESRVYAQGPELVALVRVTAGAVAPLPGYTTATLPDNWMYNDQTNLDVVFRSKDSGVTWTMDPKPLTVYGSMYSSLLPMPSGVALTYTVRNLAPELGVRVAFGSSVDTICQTQDVVVINSIPMTDQTDPSGGGYGNTIRLPDGALLTPYSSREEGYMVTTVRWALK